MLRGLVLASAVVAGACAPACEPTAPGRAGAELRIACARALARLAPEEAADAQPPPALPSEIVPTLRALSGTGMGSRVAALEEAIERAARLSLREVAPEIESAAGSFTPPDGDTDRVVAFRDEFEPELRALLAPAAARAADVAGADEALEAVREGAQRLPLRRSVDVDPVSLVTEAAVARFFGTLAEEERLAQEGEAARDGYGEPPNPDPLPGSGEEGGSR